MHQVLRRARSLFLAVGASVLLTAVFSGAAAEPKVRPLLPNIKPLPVKNLAIGEAGLYLSSHPSIAIEGCRLDEMVEEGARRCLRFDTTAANVGRGALEIRYRVGSGQTQARLIQRVYTSDGGYKDRDAAEAELHPIHGHLHYKGFAIVRLWVSSARGKKMGKKPVRTSDKNGFCLMDGEPIDDSAPSSGRYDCLAWEPGAPTDHVTGISPGWADVYTYELADQYIEISGLDDGHYLLETELDPSKTLYETTRKDNKSATHILICGNEVTLPTARDRCAP